MEIHQKISLPNYLKFKNNGKTSVDQKLRLRNFETRHGRIESGAEVKSQQGLIDVERGKSTFYQWKGKGQCSQGDRCSFRHETQDRAQKPEHTAATPYHEVEVSKKRSVGGTRNPGAILRQPCKIFSKGTEPDLKPISVCFRITGWINNQIKSRKKSNIPKRRESHDKNAVALVKSVSQLGCISQDSDSLVSQGGKSRKNRCRLYDSLSQKLRHASVREKKGPSLGKINVRAPHKRSPHAMKFEDRSHEETERQQRCARSKAWNLAKKHLQAQRKRQGSIQLSRREAPRHAHSGAKMHEALAVSNTSFVL